MCILLKTKQIVQTSACLERESTAFVAHPSLCRERLSRVGVVFAYGNRFGGHAIYKKDGKMHYIAVEGLNVGHGGGEQITGDYPGEYPWPFTGTVKQVIVDVSEQWGIDLEV
jgi:hypothetical protein